MKLNVEITGKTLWDIHCELVALDAYMLVNADKHGIPLTSETYGHSGGAFNFDDGKRSTRAVLNNHENITDPFEKFI